LAAKKNNLVHYFLHSLIGFGLLILSTLLSLDFNINEINIPITGQTLGVIIVASILPNISGVLAVLFYLLLGGFGLPIFADGASGWEVFSGGSAGFLIGFLLAAILIKTIRKELRKFSLAHALFLNITATCLILAAGIIWLTKLYGFSKALEYGFYPFWIGAIVKIGLGTGIVYGLSKQNWVRTWQ